ncbi:MAG: hypothetical protein DRN66_03390 [Candidatus Nanohalarchaeota archaeon]|nr:MAG: hypothetical protein DRN66_03390 [Candidatus Nanohaloarchaeota archaeon]
MLSKNNIKECVLELKNQLKPQEKGDIAFFRNKEKYIPHKINKEYFKDIKRTGTFGKRKVAFIDGGNNTILSASNFCVVLNRLHFSLYENNIRLKPLIADTVEFISVCTSVVQDNEIYFNINIASDNKLFDGCRTINISSVDKSISSGLYRAKISKIADVARKYAEWNYAKQIAEEQLDVGDVILRDGTLEARFTGEVNFADAAYEACMKKNIAFVGVAKTTTLFTNTGANFASVLGSHAPMNKIWYYYPIVDINSKYHRAKMYFSKMHKKSSRILRVDLFNESKCDIDELFWLLADNSKDPCFFGYPYGLIEAHKMALVTNKELQYYKTMASAYLDKSSMSDLSSQDGHDELDRAV